MYTGKVNEWFENAVKAFNNSKDGLVVIGEQNCGKTRFISYLIDRIKPTAVLTHEYQYNEIMSTIAMSGSGVYAGHRHILVTPDTNIIKGMKVEDTTILVVMDDFLSYYVRENYEYMMQAYELTKYGYDVKVLLMTAICDYQVSDRFLHECLCGELGIFDLRLFVTKLPVRFI